MGRSVGPFSSLSRRIFVFNLIGLGLLVVGVLYLNSFRSGLIDQRIASLHTQGEIIAIAIAEASAVQPGEEGGADDPMYMDPVRANLVLLRLAQPTGVRAQIFDRAARLKGDTRTLSPVASQITSEKITPPGAVEDVTFIEWLTGLYESALGGMNSRAPDTTDIARDSTGVARDAEVYAALTGEPAHGIRTNERGELIVAVSVPIQRLKAVIGVLVLSTVGGDIDEIVRQERNAIMRVFVVALAVSIVLSTMLANTIARPIRRLAEAAERGGARANRPLNPERIRIPDLTSRPDEIGYLSGALRRMTEALYDRIDAIEMFAADVAHEIKNPLTSLRSAVETLRLAKDDAARERLLKVIEKDVGRLDRLVTDITNASRLDAELVREEMESFDMCELVANLVEFNQYKAADKNREIRAVLPDKPVQVHGLEGRIAQVVVNLISNAISFTPENGKIDVSVRKVPGERVLVTVEDHGPGIPDENLASVFERFYSERPDHEEFGNHSGLGLAISRQIVDAHGGRIWAENVRAKDAEPDTPPKGARFSVELPL